MIAENLKVLLATSFTFYLKSHKFHWNVMGQDFAEYHEFFGGIYEEVYGSIDTYAETIRTVGEMSPGSLIEFAELSEIDDEESFISSGMEMISKLKEDNDVIITLLKEAFVVSEEEEAYDISDFISARLAAHKKHGWMISAFMNRQQG